MSEDRPLGSPRTADEPMAFTKAEFWHGVGCAWAGFLALLLAIEIVASIVSDLSYSAQEGTQFLSSLSFLPTVLIVSLVVGGAVSGLSLLIGAPLAYRLAIALRRESRVFIHLIAFALFGGLFGFVIGSAVYALVFMSSSTAVQPLAVFSVGGIAAAATSTAVAIAWAVAARRALRAERRHIRHLSITTGLTS